MTLLGYARVSTIRQTPALQVDALEAAGCERVFTDVGSGATMQRPAYEELRRYLRRGDLLVVWKLDRLGRSLRDLINIMAELEKEGIAFKSLTEGIDTSTAAGRMVANIFGSLAEFERELIRERTLAGLNAARARGRSGGRPSVMTPERIELVRKLREQEGMTLDQIASTVGVGRSTVVRALQVQASGPGVQADEPT